MLRGYPGKTNSSNHFNPNGVVTRVRGAILSGLRDLFPLVSQDSRATRQSWALLCNRVAVGNQFKPQAYRTESGRAAKSNDQIIKRSSRVSFRKFLFGEDFSMAKHLLSIFLSCFLVGHLSAQVPQNAAADDYNSIFKTVKWRSIGPFRGGRSNAGCGVVGDARTYYMGTTGGGLWKTDDMGITWRNVSDGYFKTGSVGAVAVAVFVV